MKGVILFHLIENRFVVQYGTIMNIFAVRFSKMNRLNKSNCIHFSRIQQRTATGSAQYNVRTKYTKESDLSIAKAMLYYTKQFKL